MPLNEITPGLRTIHNGSKSTLKPQLVIQPGDELTVSDDVAGQLLKDPSFKDGPAPIEPEPETPKPETPKRGKTK